MLVCVANAIAANRIQHEQAKLQAAQHQLREKKRELEFAQMRAGDLRRQLLETVVGIREANTRLSKLSGETRTEELDVRVAQTELTEARETLARFNSVYRQRIVQIYEHGDLDYAEVLLAATSFSDFVERWEDLRLFVKADQTAVRARKRAARRVLLEETRLEATQQSLEQAVSAEVDARSALTGLSDERSQLLSVADAQRTSVARQVAELEELTAQEEASLEALIVAREREIEAQREAEKTSRNRTGQPASTAIATGSGILMWPVRGPITSPFGWRMHPIYHRLILHEGIDIGADTGTPIKAADAGRVIIAGWVSGYGDYVAIDHGAGVSTGYGHCSTLYVSVGQDVQKGQVIGAVGSTGNSTGPHLHFEVRLNGRAVDPLPRLSP